MSFGQVFFFIFVLYLPEWTSGDKILCSSLHECRKKKDTSESVRKNGKRIQKLWTFKV